MLAGAVTFWRWLTGQPISLDSGTALADPATERRVWLRYAANLNIHCEEVGGDTEGKISAIVGDVSRGGLKVISSSRFEPGTLLSVELPGARGQAPLVVLACVVRARPHGESDWAMGCRFSAELSEEQLQTFGAARSRPASPDPRGWSRFPCDVTAVYRRISEDLDIPRSARVLNIAASGMALLVEEEIPIGELLSTELHDGAGQPIITILACVVHTQTIPEGHRLGCTFVRELTDKDLQALV